MYYGALKNCDIANGTGVRISLFVSGCRNRCKGCFQPETWDFSYGTLYTKETTQQILKMLAPDYIDGLTLLGGDPFEPENQPEVLDLMRQCKERYPQKTIWLYTGYRYETLRSGTGHPCCTCTEEMLSLIDVLVDGKFVEELKNISLSFRGSSNQRLIDMNETRKQKKLVLLPDKKRNSVFG